MKNFIPYVKLQTSKGTLNFLIDTGANKSYIDPKHVNLEKCRSTQPTTVRNVSGSHKIDKFVEFNPFIDIPNTKSLKFFVFHFHPFFDGLIGYQSLQELQAQIITCSNQLKLPAKTIQMFRRYPNSHSLNFHENDSITKRLPISIKEGDVFLENDIKLHENVFVPSGLYKIENHRVTFSIISSQKQDINLCLDTDAIFTEINNFETSYVPLGNSKINSNYMKQLRLDHLNAEEKSKLLHLISKYQDTFYMEGTDLSFTNVIKHNIVTKDEIPVHAKSYRYPHCHKQEVQEQISKMLAQGIIQPSTSPWCSPIWIVPKKPDSKGNKKWRLVVDYRKLNEKTVDDKYPLPNITEILDKLGKCQYFTTLDLASGFHQIEVHPQDVPKTAFSVEHGLYEYLRMPFGLKNAPATFQRIMDHVLRDYIGRCCLVYMDDIIIYSTSLQEHLENLKKNSWGVAKGELKSSIGQK